MYLRYMSTGPATEIALLEVEERAIGLQRDTWECITNCEKDYQLKQNTNASRTR